jgi:S-adenosyl-L-methionine hydrolase (adenosine-forming)
MPILTLTTDIGQQDYLVGAIKGQFVQADPACNTVDISHYLSPYNYLQAAYICTNAYKHFPPGTFHLVIVNLFDGEPKEMILAKHNEQFIACPNNGVLTMITGTKPKELVALPVNGTSKGLLDFTRVVADAFGKISSGEAISSIGVLLGDMVEKYPLRSTIGGDWIEGQIIFIDNFENVVVNITQEQFEEQRKGRRFKIVFKRDEMIERISGSYADVAQGEKLVLFNSAGYMEIAINKGNAAGLFGLKGFTGKDPQVTSMMQNRLFYQTVKVFFE